MILQKNDVILLERQLTRSQRSRKQRHQQQHRHSDEDEEEEEEEISWAVSMEMRMHKQFQRWVRCCFANLQALSSLVALQEVLAVKLVDAVPSARAKRTCFLSQRFASHRRAHAARSQRLCLRKASSQHSISQVCPLNFVLLQHCLDECALLLLQIATCIFHRS